MHGGINKATHYVFWRKNIGKEQHPSSMRRPCMIGSLINAWRDMSDMKVRSVASD